VARLQVDAAGLLADEAADGREAVAMAGVTRYAAILMDMQMPRLSGLDATRLIRAMPGYADVPIIAMTANAFDEDRLRCIEAGMDDRLIKPFRPEALFSMLGHWIGRRR
jgi:two-component system sensor histidine kinase/response regulator